MSLESVERGQILAGNVAPAAQRGIRLLAFDAQAVLARVDGAPFGVQTFELGLFEAGLRAPPIQGTVEGECELFHAGLSERSKSRLLRQQEQLLQGLLHRRRYVR